MRLSLSRIRRVALPVLMAVTSVLAGLLSLVPASAGADVIPILPAKPTTNTPCGVSPRQDAPIKYAHVVWILMENKSYSQVMGSPDAPYINKLGSECGAATNYFGIAHPSLPSHIALTSGGLQGAADDNPPSSHPLNVPSIFSQVTSRTYLYARAVMAEFPYKCHGYLGLARQSVRRGTPARGSALDEASRQLSLPGY